MSRIPQPRDGRRAEARLWLGAFLLLALPLCVLLALAVPLGEVADEPAHLMRAASLYDGQVIGRRETIRLTDGREVTAAGVRCDPVWEEISRTRLPADVSRAAPPPDPAVGAGPWQRTGAFAPLYTIATYFPAFYAPAAAALAVGHAFDLSARASARLGRLANVSAYVLIALAALALARRGRAWLFCILATPMSLSLAASFNQDGLIVVTAVLAAALLTRPPDAPTGRCRYAAAAVLVALILLAKPPYAPIALMLLLPLPAGPWRGVLAGLGSRLATVVLVVLPAVAWTGYATKTVATPIPRTPYEAGPLWPGDRPATFAGTDPAAQLRVLAAEPLRVLTVPARFLLTLKHATILAEGAVGILGWLDRYLPKPIYWLWAAALAAAFAGPGTTPGSGRSLALLTLAAGLALWLVVLSQYLSWTNVGEERVDGPQGRYLLPILPLFALVLRDRRVAWGRSRSAVSTALPAILPIAAAAVDLAVVPLMML